RADLSAAQCCARLFTPACPSSATVSAEGVFALGATASASKSGSRYGPISGRKARSPRLRRRRGDRLTSPRSPPLCGWRGFGRPFPLPPDTSLTAPFPPGEGFSGGEGLLQLMNTVDRKDLPFQVPYGRPDLDA